MSAGEAGDDRALDLAGDAATGSFRSSMETLSGKTDLEIVANGGIDETWIGVLDSLPVNATFAPIIEGQGFVAGVGTIPIYGIDAEIASKPSACCVPAKATLAEKCCEPVEKSGATCCS